MKKIIFILLITGCSLAIVNAQSGWYPLNSGTAQKINDIQFLDANTGFFVSGVDFTSGTIKKSTNGGQSWTVQYSGSGIDFRGIHFVNFNTGFAVGYAIFLKTTNGGTTWSSPAPFNASGESVYFLDGNTGAVASYPNKYTTNSGLNWLESACCTDCYSNDIQFINSNTGFVAGAPGVCKTTNAGINWAASLVAVYGYSLSFLDINNGICSGGNRRIYKTTNAGVNWNLVYTQGTYSNYVFDVKYIDINNAAAAGDTGLILKSTNGGNNWFTQSSGTTQNLWAVFFIDAMTGWAGGASGTLLKTTTGGWTGIRTINTELPSRFELNQNFPNPFNPKTVVRFQLPAAGFTKLVIYDLLGKEVATIVNEELNPGTYEVEWDASNFPSGVYFYSLVADEFKDTRKMILLK